MRLSLKCWALRSSSSEVSIGSVWVDIVLTEGRGLGAMASILGAEWLVDRLMFYIYHGMGSSMCLSLQAGHTNGRVHSGCSCIASPAVACLRAC